VQAEARCALPDETRALVMWSGILLLAMLKGPHLPSYSISRLVSGEISPDRLFL
jgi:hypothetical protein